MHYLAFQTSITGIPAIAEFGSSMDDEFTISFAPTTITRSTSDIPSFTSSISWTISYGTPTSANNTFSYPGIRPATGWIPNLILTSCSASNFVI